MSGEPFAADDVRRALERLLMEQPFLVSARYDSWRAQVCYWDEAADGEQVTAAALQLWREHEDSADLPPWRVTGLEVVDRMTARRRWAASSMPPVLALGEIRPLRPEE